jgi:hypothetical protein
MPDIFSKITDGINKGVATVGANSKAVMEKAKIKSAIGNLENERKQLIQLLGQRVFDDFRSVNELMADEGIASFFAEIEKRLELLFLQEKKLEQIEEELKMVTGGTKSVGGEASSCMCGHPNPPSAKFCSGCGRQL